MPAPTVSVIIPCYNTAQFVGDTLASVFAQTRRDFEVIVVNDGSPDTPLLEQALAPYRDRIVYIVQENRGLAGARNTAIRAAQGEYVALLDSDDIWEPNYLEVQLAQFERDPSIDVLYPDAIIFGDTPHAGRRAMEFSPSDGEVTFERIVRQEVNVRVFATVRRDLLFRVGLFDEALRSSEDYDLWLRIAKAGGRIAYHRQPLVRYRRHGASLSADPEWMSHHIQRVLEKTLANLPLTAGEAALVEHQIARWAATLRFFQGKKAFFRGDTATAAAAIEESNRFFRRWKLSVVVFLLRRVPPVLSWGYSLRDRLLYRVSTRY